MSSPLRPSGEDLLQAALSDAFSVGDVPRERVAGAPPVNQPSGPSTEPGSTASSQPAASQPVKPDVDAEAIGPEAYEAWKAEYDSQLANWRHENAEQQARAEAERAKWEKLRAQERAERKASGLPEPEQQPILGPQPGNTATVENWEKILSSSRHETSSAADARDLVSGETPGKHSDAFLMSVLPGSHEKRPSTQKTDADIESSQRWEDVPSDPSELTSSFPSLSFPEGSNAHSQQPSQSPPSHQHHHHHSHHGHGHADGHATATMAIFDSSLSPRTRFWAFVGAISINLFLPFVNGVMLGFGEIFAKNVVMGWFGWNTSSVGLRTGRRRS